MLGRLLEVDMRKLCVLAAAAALLGLSGCAALMPAKGQIVSGVTKYCTNVSPISRYALRAEVNAMLTGVAKVEVTCANDPVAQ